MVWEPWFAMGVLGLVLALLALTSVAADLALIAGVLALLAVGILTPKEALAGLSNEAMVTVAVLFVVSAGVRETGAITWFAERLFGRPKTAEAAVTRLTVPVTTIGAFMNNTPLVAMLIPAVADWAKSIRIPVSKLMIPLSYAAILSGLCTLLGTSTNLVVNGLVIDVAARQHAAGTPTDLPLGGMGLWTITPVGVPTALAGLAFMIFTSRWLLPNRKPAISESDDPREYTVEMLVPVDSPLVGKTIEQAGLRHLPGTFLAEIDRESGVLPAVSPQERLRAGDRLVFVGIVDSVVDLRKIRGLIPATDQVFKLGAAMNSRCLIEAVVSNTCPLLGKTIRDGRFRSVYDAVVIAVARNGERLHQKIGDITLRVGDTLLLEASPSFADRQRNSRDFFLVSRLENSKPPNHERGVIAMSILVTMIVVVSTGFMTLLTASLLASALMLISGCMTMNEARRAMDWETLLAIAASFGVAAGLEKTGAADMIAGSMIRFGAGNPWLSLAVVYGITLLTTELVTNNAAAALMFPLAISTAQSLGANSMPFVIVVMIAASAGFATPIGYQTNLMVYGPGGYKFSDYLKIGLPMDVFIWIVAVLLTPLVFPFH